MALERPRYGTSTDNSWWRALRSLFFSVTCHVNVLLFDFSRIFPLWISLQAFPLSKGNTIIRLSWHRIDTFSPILRHFSRPILSYAIICITINNHWNFWSDWNKSILIGAIFSLTITHAAHLNILAMVMHADASPSIFHAGMRLWMRRWSSYLCIAYLSMRVHGYANKLAEADDGDCIFPAATDVRGLIVSI